MDTTEGKFGGLPDGFARLTAFIAMVLVVCAAALYSMYNVAHGGVGLTPPDWFMDIFQAYGAYYVGLRSLDTVKEVLGSLGSKSKFVG